MPIQYCNPKDLNLHRHRSDNLKSLKLGNILKSNICFMNIDKLQLRCMEKRNWV